MLSQAYMTERDPVKLKGLHGRLKLKLSRTGGAMSDGNVKVITAPFRPRSNAPVAPVASRQPTSHGSPSASSAVGAPRTPPDVIERASDQYTKVVEDYVKNGQYRNARKLMEKIAKKAPRAYNLVVQKLKRKGLSVAIHTDSTPNAKKSLTY